MSVWQQLTTHSTPRCPKLYYKLITSSSNGIRLEFTDLVILWRHTSSKSDILRTAKLIKCPIQVSDSNDQLKVFFSKLALSLETGDNTLRQSGSSGSEEFTLDTKIDLPKPFLPLKWHFVLKPESAATLSEDLLRPILHSASIAALKVNNLRGVVDAKDRVIAKLLEKYGTMGVDLSIIFPNITAMGTSQSQRMGKTIKSSSVKDAQKAVPGLAPFAKDRWEQVFREKEEGVEGKRVSSDELQRLATGLLKCSDHSGWRQHEKWLSQLPGHTSTDEDDTGARFDGDTTMTIVDDNKGLDTSTDTDADDGSSSPVTRARPAARPTTPDFDDLPPPPRPSLRRKATSQVGLFPPTSSPSSRAQSSPQRNNILSSPQRQISSSPLKPISRKRRFSGSTSGDSTDSDSEMDARELVLPPSAKKPRLGALGLSKAIAQSAIPNEGTISRQKTFSDSPLPSSAPIAGSETEGQLSSMYNKNDASSMRPPPSPAKRRLGQIGMKRAGSAEQEPKPQGIDKSTGPGTKESRKDKLGALRSRHVSLDPAISTDDNNNDNTRTTRPSAISDQTSLDLVPNSPSSSSSSSPSPTSKSSPSSSHTRGSRTASKPESQQIQAKYASNLEAQPTPTPTPALAPKPDPKEEPTAEEKAEQRREELKRKSAAVAGVNASSSSGRRETAGAGGGGGGLRKKRKF